MISTNQKPTGSNFGAKSEPSEVLAGIELHGKNVIRFCRPLAPVGFVLISHSAQGRAASRHFRDEQCLFRAPDLAARTMGPPEGIQRFGWHVRLGRTCRAGRVHYPELETSFEVDLILRRQDKLEEDQWGSEACKADHRRAARMMFGDCDTEDWARREVSRVKAPGFHPNPRHR